MSEEYYKVNAINSGSLATFDIWDRNLRDEPEDKYEYWLGKCFEGVIREQYDDAYTLPFFTIKNLNKRIIKAIIEESPLDEVVRIKKDGNVYEADKDIYEQVFIIKQETRDPIDQDDFELIKKTVDNMMTMPVMNGLTAGELFEHAEFDVAVYWEDEEGNKMKALFDVISNLETDTFGEYISIPLDLKYYASPYVFKMMFGSKLWVQERHYAEGIKHYCKEKGSTPYYKMPFLVGYKDSGLTQVNILEESNVDHAKDKYRDLLMRYIAWINDGKKETGHLKPRDLKVW